MPYYKPGLVDDNELRALLRKKVAEELTYTEIAKFIGVSSGWGLRQFAEGKTRLKRSGAESLREYLVEGKVHSKLYTSTSGLTTGKVPVKAALKALEMLEAVGKTELSIHELVAILVLAMKK